jgi:hypothetical protein
VARLLGITRFWNYISDWIECRVHLRPEKDNALDLGSSDYRWRTIYTGTAIGARVYNSADISVANAQWTSLTFNSENFDTDGIHSTTTNTGRLTCVTSGTYLIFGSVRWADKGTGRRIMQILHGGTDTIARVEYAIVSSSTVMTISTVYNLSAGQYVELSVYQSSGGDLNAMSYGDWSPEFGMVRIA